ncbi:AAA family ATPase [Faecalicatena contorta]|uniref:CHC2 zinc finger domain-containing protein n=1 Tax=Faecalicatena contorta TaxID=39482 RepID=UPI00196001F7|nr:CHC2 zinc finger domain-containing protein [Faecalicatena contorta]MBM6685512.1 AAA family ATPase [Faecalicatena contorta]MBM6710255.1 AAA family ATPase [Faecalicatena contorta]
MLVNKKDIEKAKEKLGDDNAFIIAELLELEDFDDKNMKACCPYHSEDTASFIYNKSGYYFKCFGCGKTVDIIDVYMETQNATFLEAVQWLFEKADIEFSCPEQHVKTIPRYKYPHTEPLENDRTEVYQYLASRGISKNVADYLDIRADKNGNMAFLTYDQYDTLTVVNYRKARKIEKGENKCWFQKDADAADLLWNMNRVNNTKPLVITEGQIDCASVVQAGYLNCVSVLKGSQGMGWIENCWDWLQQFNEIIVFSDGDAPGIKMRDEIINRLGAMRCKYVEVPKELEYKDTGKMYPVKDASEILQCKGEKYLLELINTAKDIPITSVAKLSEIKELNPTQMDGFEVGIKEMDRELMKIFTGGVTLLTGLPSAGKTTFLNQVVLMAMDSGYKTFLFSRELLNGMSKGWFSQVASGRRNMQAIRLSNGTEFWVVNDDAKKAITKYYDDLFYIYRDEEENSEDKLFESMELCATKKGLRLFVIDNLMTVQLKSAKEENINQAQTDFMNRLIKFSMKYDVAVLCVAHPRKLQSGADIGLFDIAGSQNIVNLATRTIGLKRIKEDEKKNPSNKWYGYDVIISIIKDRIFGSTKDIPVYYDKVDRRFYSNYEEFDRIYKWDTKEYYEKLQYPIEPREQFPDR